MPIVKFYVWGVVEQEIERLEKESDSELINRAIILATEEHPLVPWEYDESLSREIEIKEE